MSGFDNGTATKGINFQVKQFGKILQGLGPPVPQAGVTGDLYMDTQQSFLYEKRSAEAGGGADPWGHYLFQIPAPYNATLKWFGSTPPTDDMGAVGDYALLWAGFGNYGLQPLIFGPKLVSGWEENGNGPDTQLDPAFAAATFPQSTGVVLPVGILDEGATVSFSTSTQMIGVGVAVDEFALQVPLTNTALAPVSQAGVQSQAAAVAVTLNPLYTAQDAHGV